MFELALSCANRRGWMSAALLILALPVGGCATSIADIPLVGVPSDAPARPKEAGAYPAIHDLPADREQSAMEPSEQAKIQKELIAARDRQAGNPGATPGAPGQPPPKTRRPSE
jgi:hypothetical protein